MYICFKLWACSYFFQLKWLKTINPSAILLFFSPNNILNLKDGLCDNKT